MSSGKHAKSKGALNGNSITALVIIVLALVQEFASLILGRHGGAFSHIVWWAMGDPFTWRWAAVGAPIIGLLWWSSIHFMFQWGEGLELLVFIGAALVIMGALVIFLG